MVYRTEYHVSALQRNIKISLSEVHRRPPPQKKKKKYIDKKNIAINKTSIPPPIPDI